MELSIKDIILKNRAYLIGLAMILVLTYHQLNIGLDMGLATPLFRHLDSSVDIFFYLSALGVSFSYKKNDLKTFYKRRYVRILPMYFLLVLSYWGGTNSMVFGGNGIVLFNFPHSI